MDKYVLHSDFCAIDMNDVDVILGYPWMTTIGTININVEKKFVKLWYKKKKITLQDVSLSKKEGPMGEMKEVIAESEVESEVESTEGHEDKNQEGPQNTEEAKEPHVEKSKKVESRAKVDVYHHPHHIEKQNHQGRGVSINTLIMDQHGPIKETNQEVHGGIPTLHDDINGNNPMAPKV
jgi:hypothetical protein